MAVSHRQFPVPVKVAAINEHLVCRLCAGYMIEATVIVECLHAFCRSCIVKHVTKSEEKHCCPTCNVLIREAQPLEGLRLDRTLQEIIDKLLPHAREEDERQEEIFNATNIRENRWSPSKIKPSSLRNSPVEQCLPPAKEDKVSLLIRPFQSLVRDDKRMSLSHFKKYLRCSGRMTVLHLKRFVLEKSGWCDLYTDQVEILCKGNALRNELTLEFIWRIRWGDVNSSLVLEYARKEKNDPVHSKISVAIKPSRKRKRCLRATLHEGAGKDDGVSDVARPSDTKELDVMGPTILDISSSSSEHLGWIDELDGQHEPIELVESLGNDKVEHLLCKPLHVTSS